MADEEIEDNNALLAGYEETAGEVADGEVEPELTDQTAYEKAGKITGKTYNPQEARTLRRVIPTMTKEAATLSHL